jgi:hypothetical protein
MSKPKVTNEESAILGDMPGAEQFLQLGMLYSTGRSMPTDMVSAHKWFNIAAMHSVPPASGLRGIDRRVSANRAPGIGLPPPADAGGSRGGLRLNQVRRCSRITLPRAFARVAIVIGF